MTGAYRVTFLRPGGWTRLGGAGAVGVIFATPMLWALGGFGDGDDSVQRAVIFLLSGVWFFVTFGYMVGWALRGFIVRLKEADEDEDAPPHRPGGPAHLPPHQPSHPPAPHAPPPPHRPPGH